MSEFIIHLQARARKQRASQTAYDMLDALRGLVMYLP
jgi:hypothetical protein